MSFQWVTSNRKSVPRYYEMLAPEWNCWSPGILQMTASLPLLPSAMTVWTAKSGYCTSETQQTGAICQIYSISHQVNNSNDDYEFTVDFTKNNHGLGFTISTYTGNLNSGNGIEYSRLPNVNALRKHILTRCEAGCPTTMFWSFQSIALAWL